MKTYTDLGVKNTKQSSVTSAIITQLEKRPASLIEEGKWDANGKLGGKEG